MNILYYIYPYKVLLLRYGIISTYQSMPTMRRRPLRGDPLPAYYLATYVYVFKLSPP